MKMITKQVVGRFAKDKLKISKTMLVKVAMLIRIYYNII